MNLETPNDLEEVRRQLGMNRKQIAELLGVDPSAWTRWTRSSKGAPTMAYRALGWYMELKRANPQVHEKFEVERLKKEISRLKKSIQVHNHSTQPRSSSDIYDNLQIGLPLDWSEEKQDLIKQIEKQDSITAGWKILLLINLFVLGFLIMMQF